MEENAEVAENLWGPQIFELFCLSQGQKRMTINCEPKIIYCKIL